MLPMGLGCLNSEETTQLRRKATWEKGPTTEPRTHDLRSNMEFQPREQRNRPRSFVYVLLCVCGWGDLAVVRGKEL